MDMGPPLYRPKVFSLAPLSHENVLPSSSTDKESRTYGFIPDVPMIFKVVNFKKDPYEKGKIPLPSGLPACASKPFSARLQEFDSLFDQSTTQDTAFATDWVRIKATSSIRSKIASMRGGDKLNMEYVRRAMHGHYELLCDIYTYFGSIEPNMQEFVFSVDACKLWGQACRFEFGEGCSALSIESLVDMYKH